MAERRDVQEAVREAVDRTIRATADTRERAQGAAGGVVEAVDDLVRGAERNLARRSRTVRAAVEDRLPASQDELKAVQGELAALATRVAELEERLRGS